MQDKIYTMPAGAAFLPELARGLERRFGDRLPNALILLPTRRAVRELADILTGETGAKILPRMRPLADIDPDEPPFEPGYLTGLVKPAMSGARRRFELARLVGHYHRSSGDPVDAAAKLALADPLLAILDDAAMEEVSLEALTELEAIRDMAAQHFQDAAKFYEILQLNWPNHIQSLGVMEPMARRVALLNALTQHWEDSPPDHPVIIAGSTGTLGATARLMRCVGHLKDGLIVLPGLDKNMPDDAWDKIFLNEQDGEDPTSENPQFSLKNLINVLGVNRNDVSNWEDISSDNPRQALISEALVPANSTSDWPERIKNLVENSKNKNFFSDALKGLSVIEARTDNEEALAIALILRETVHNRSETAALVTPDPALARRVKARLRRWHINVDYSQGEPLEETALGSFLASVLRAAGDLSSPVNLAALFKHPLTTMGQARGLVSGQWLVLEKKCFRKGAAITKEGLNDGFILGLADILSPLASGDDLPASQWAKRLTETVEALAATDEDLGAARLWREDAGEKAASLITDLIAHGAVLGDMSLTEFAKLFGTLMRGKVVRSRFGTHPRLQILGPLEARMLSADTIILGGLNEGIWPAGAGVMPFLSRGMRKTLGLSLPERRFGLAAHDFQQLACNPRVILTRAQRSEDGPRVASRWLWRLQTLIKGALGDGSSEALKPDKPYLEWARALDFVHPDDVENAGRPAPTPDPDHRWPDGKAALSVTKIKTWVRDPYAIYAQYILGLKPLDDLGADLGPREYGSALHQGIEDYLKHHNNKPPVNSPKYLASALENAYLACGFEPYHLAKERPRLSRIAEDLIGWMAARQEDRSQGLWSEIVGKWTVPDTNFVLTGKPDWIDKSGEGYTVVDFKTGAPPSNKEVIAGFDPQLPLLGAMIENGAFENENLKAGTVKDMLYVRIKGSGERKDFERSIVFPPKDNKPTAEDYIGDAVGDLQNLIAEFEKPDTAYHSQPRAKYQDDYGDYDHLARRGEWAKLGDKPGGDNG